MLPFGVLIKQGLSVVALILFCFCVFFPPSKAFMFVWMLRPGWNPLMEEICNLLGRPVSIKVK